MKHIFKIMTFSLSLFWLCLLLLYTCSIVGSFAHELTHEKYSINPTVLEVNYDGSGKMKAGSFFVHSHEWVYLNGYLVEVGLMLVSAISLIIVINFRGNYEKD